MTKTGNQLHFTAPLARYARSRALSNSCRQNARRRICTATGASLLLIGFGGTAHAQDQPASQTTPVDTGADARSGNPSDKAAAATATTAPIGPLASFGQKLADDGIKLRAFVTNETAGNVTGGAGKGTTNVGQAYIGADLDLDKIIGWNGASFHVTVYHDYGTSLSRTITGTFPKQEGIYKNPYNRLHFGLFALEQKLDDDKFDVVVGRLGSTGYYAHLHNICDFQSNIACGIPAMLSSEAGNSLLPSATWGGNVKYHFDKRWYFQTGAFEVNPTIAPTNGLVVSTAGATGYTVPVELGYENLNPKTTRYPSEWKLGAYYSTGSHVDPYYDADGQSAGLNGTKQRVSDRDRAGMYFIASQTFWHPDANRPRSLTAFSGVVQEFETDEIINRQIYGGLVLKAPFEGRPLDSAGIKAGWFHISDKELAYLRDSRINLGGDPGHQSPNEVALEANYTFGLGRSIRLSPNIQYIINPDNSQRPKIDFVPKNMLAFGLKLTVNVAGLLGLPGPK